MRYYVRLGGGTRGPLGPEELRLLPGFGPARLVCPEGRDLRNRRNWTPARAVPELSKLAPAKAAETAPRAGGFRLKAPAIQAARAAEEASKARGASRKPASGARPLAAGLGLALAAAAAVLFSGSRSGREPLARPSRRAPLGAVEAARTILAPTCVPGAALARAFREPMPGGRVEMVLPADGTAGRAEARYAFDERRGTLRPLNAEARRLADFRKGCP